MIGHSQDESFVCQKGPGSMNGSAIPPLVVGIGGVGHFQSIAAPVAYLLGDHLPLMTHHDDQFPDARPHKRMDRVLYERPTQH